MISIHCPQKAEYRFLLRPVRPLVQKPSLFRDRLEAKAAFSERGRGDNLADLAGKRPEVLNVDRR
jgi:hypothetical protein